MEGEPILAELGAELHRRLVAGDVTAPAEVAELFLAEIVQNLRGRYPNLHDPDLVDTAVEDAVLSYLRRPQQFDPDRSTLWRYLKMSARGDLLNLLSERKGDLAALAGPGVVELDAPGTEDEVGQGGLTVEEQVFIALSPIWQTVQELFDDPTDREIVILMMERVRSTTEYARVLGVESLRLEEQERVVKRNKDRVKKTLQRRLDRGQLREE